MVGTNKATFSEDQIIEFQEAFCIFDQKGDGKIQVSQIGEVLRALGQNPTEADVKKLSHQHRPGTDRGSRGMHRSAVQTQDSDDTLMACCKQAWNERISFEVFLPIMQTISRQRPIDTADDFIEGLRHFDKDGNGYISSAELRHLMTHLGEKLTDEEVEQLLAGQEDSQGNINYEEFVRLVLNA
ncbi:Myosin-2 essential light chain [Chionoecetes opilio]|uniref:Myosin-2 essential light chain n=1 Tax=Chionoecetes opilio TaxID=41210 RepID=A0A8J4YJ03_CHIOP|nr:Myosin-2 essential light chain [Chionoecetes opilio]